MTAAGTLAGRLGRPVALAAALLASALALAYGSGQSRRQALAGRDAAIAAYKRADTRLQQIRKNQQKIPEQADLFLRLQRQGIVGEARRLEWEALLHETGRQLGLAAMKYEFAAPAAEAAALDTQHLDFHGNPMRLQLQLLHEGELLDFLERLQREARALVILRSCRLTRLPAAEQSGAPLAHLGADCELDWATAYIKGREAL